MSQGRKQLFSPGLEFRILENLVYHLPIANRANQNKKDLNEIEEYFIAFKKEFPDIKYHYILNGRYFEKLNEKEKALYEYKSAINKIPLIDVNFDDAYIYVAKLLESTGHYEKCIRYLNDLANKLQLNECSDLSNKEKSVIKRQYVKMHKLFTKAFLWLGMEKEYLAHAQKILEYDSENIFAKKIFEDKHLADEQAVIKKRKTSSSSCFFHHNPYSLLQQDVSELYIGKLNM